MLGVRRREFITLLGSGVADNRTCATGGDAGDRIFQQPIIRD
jgi:hypothetical protein